MQRGVIAAGSEQSAAAGAAAYELGGNAVDAAVAAAFATASGDPAITSLAGGGILVHRHGATGTIEVCDFFSDAPGRGAQRKDDAARLDFYPVEVHFENDSATQTFHVGRAAAAVPGTLHGLCAVRERWGSLPLADLVKPAVRDLRDGVALTDYQVASNGVLRQILELSELGRELFFDADGEPLAPGAPFRNRRLAQTLERLGAEGLERLLEDVLIPALLDDFGEEQGGRLTREDLTGYQPRFTTGSRVRYGDVDVVAGTETSFGGPFVTWTLELFRRAGLAATAPQSDDRFQRLTCVFRAISDARAAVHDLTERPDGLDLLWSRAEKLLAGERPQAQRGESYPPGNTTHISTLDAEGNAASLTLSYGEGNGHAVGDTGLLMNNLMGEADLFPRGFRVFTPGARLKTMMAPTVMQEATGSVTVLGSGGSNRIRTVIPQVMFALLDDGLRPDAAIDRARIHYEDGVLSAEAYRLDDPAAQLASASELAEELRLFPSPSLFFGGVHLVRRDRHGLLDAVGDPRRGGAVRFV